MRYVIVLIIVIVTMETAILLVEITNALKNPGKNKWHLKILILTTASLYVHGTINFLSAFEILASNASKHYM